MKNELIEKIWFNIQSSEKRSPRHKNAMSRYCKQMMYDQEHTVFQHRDLTNGVLTVSAGVKLDLTKMSITVLKRILKQTDLVLADPGVIPSEKSLRMQPLFT